MKTYKGRVETEEIKKDLVRFQHGYFVYKEKEKNFIRSGNRFGGTYEHIRCRDFRVESDPTETDPEGKKCPCTISIMRTKNEGGLDETSVYMMADHNNERMSIPRVGLDDGMKKKAEAWYKRGCSAPAAARKWKFSISRRENRLPITATTTAARYSILKAKSRLKQDRLKRSRTMPEKLSSGFFSEERYKHSPFVLNFRKCRFLHIRRPRDRGVGK